MKRKLKIAEVMNRNVVCLHENTTLRQAAERMLQSDQSVFPVVDDSSAFKGLVSLLDLLRPCFPLSEGGAYPDLDAIFADRVGLLAHDKNGALSPEDKVADAAEIMISGRLQSLPVVEAGQAVGILRARDVIRLLY